MPSGRISIFIHTRYAAGITWNARGMDLAERLSGRKIKLYHFFTVACSSWRCRWSSTASPPTTASLLSDSPPLLRVHIGCQTSGGSMGAVFDQPTEANLLQLARKVDKEMTHGNPSCALALPSLTAKEAKTASITVAEVPSSSPSRQHSLARGITHTKREPRRNSTATNGSSRTEDADAPIEVEVSVT